MVALGLRCCAWAFSIFGGLGLLFLVVQELIVVVSLAVEHRLGGGGALGGLARGLSVCVPRAGSSRASMLVAPGLQLPSGFSRFLESSKIRDKTLVSSVGMRILISSVFMIHYYDLGLDHLLCLRTLCLTLGIRDFLLCFLLKICLHVVFESVSYFSLLVKFRLLLFCL